MLIEGGAMSGYCAIGSVMIAPMPPIMMTIASTQAKIGRPTKKREIMAR